MQKTDFIKTPPNSQLVGAFEIPVRGQLHYLVKTSNGTHFIVDKEQYVELCKPVR